MNITVKRVVLPNVSLTNFQLIEAAKLLKIEKFRGITLPNELPKKLRINKCGVLNLDDSTGQGTHWVCWFKNGANTLSFDSYELLTLEELMKYIGSPVYINTE
jgi:hypothetical protein